MSEIMIGNDVVVQSDFSDDLPYHLLNANRRIVLLYLGYKWQRGEELNCFLAEGADRITVNVVFLLE